MSNEYTSTRIWRKTLRVLRFIHAHTGESIVAILDRLAVAEWERLQREDKERAENS